MTANNLIKNTMIQYEIDKERANLREQILSAREHADRTTCEMRNANLAHMYAAIAALRDFNQKCKNERIAKNAI